MPNKTYILKSEGQCLRQMCLIKLKYNGTIPKRKDGCLSFILETNGQLSKFRELNFFKYSFYFILSGTIMD
jgi:hypothetical protein